MTVWDVGANVGLFAFTAAGLGAEVVAVEADIWLARNLRVAAQQPSIKVEVVPAAIAASVGLEEFVVAASNRATNYLSTASGSTMTGGVRERQLVPTLTLDSLLDHFSVPEVIKIDIEGAELMALEGGRRVLQYRPTILLEVAGQNREGIHRILAPLGYRYVDAVTGRHCDALATANVICTAHNYLPPRAHAG
jgi:FkbM family methyltransferase